MAEGFVSITLLTAFVSVASLRAQTTSQAGAAQVARLAIIAAAAGLWDSVVSTIDSTTVSALRGLMNGLPALEPAPGSSGSGAAYPLLRIMGKDSLQQLERLSDFDFVSALFRALDALSYQQTTPPRRQHIVVLDSVVIHDSIADVQYRVDQGDPQTVHMRQSGGRWYLLFDAAFAFLFVAGRE